MHSRLPARLGPREPNFPGNRSVRAPPSPQGDCSGRAPSRPTEQSRAPARRRTAPPSPAVTLSRALTLSAARHTCTRYNTLYSTFSVHICAFEPFEQREAECCTATPRSAPSPRPSLPGDQSDQSRTELSSAFLSRIHAKNWFDLQLKCWLLNRTFWKNALS